MIYGWDISTSIIGVTVLEPTRGGYIASEYCDLRKIDSTYEKADRALQFVTEMINKHGESGDNDHYVEDRLGNFAFGRSMLQTLMLLAAFNMLVSWFIWSSEPKIKHVHPTTVKSIMKSEGLIIPPKADKKKLTLEYVMKREPAFPAAYNRNGKPQPWCYDMADSYIIAKAGFRKFFKHAT